MPCLVVRSRVGTQCSVELSRRPILVGRAENCDVVLPHDGEVSREHALVWVDEHGQVLVADKGSKNGTRVDGGEPFFNATRSVQRIIRIGAYELELVQTPVVVHAEATPHFAPEPPGEPENTRYFPSSHDLDLNQQRLGLLMSLTERIAGAFEQKQLLEQALDACCDALGFERGLIALKTPRGEAELPVTRNIPRDASGAYKVSRTLINRAVLNNPAVDLVDQLSESLVRYPICSALCVPIMHRDNILGVIYGDRVTRGTTYTPQDVDFLAAIARQVGVGLENLRLFQAYLNNQRIQFELRQARAIQRGLLPAGALRVGCVTLAGWNEPSEAVGGDFFDYFELGQGCIGLVLADVSGHGLPAAIVAANLQAAVRVALTADAPLTDVADRLNRLVCSNIAGAVFITCILGRVKAATGVLEYVNAGHPGPLLLRPGRVISQTDGHSLPLGVEPQESYTVVRIDPDPELDAMVFYTDGLIEAADPDGRMLELGAVQDVLASLPVRTTDAVTAALLGLVRRHVGDGRPRDDLTLLAVDLGPR